MNANDIEGAVKNGAGQAQSFAGKAIDDPGMELEGDVLQVEGDIQQMIGQVQDRITQAADKVASTAVKVGEQARETYANVTIRVQRAADAVDPFVKQQPYAALGLAALGGLVFGLLYAGRGPKIVYVKPRL
jgi:uncharacterized protein YjbJ (UPF0337 family)